MSYYLGFCYREWYYRCKKIGLLFPVNVVYMNVETWLNVEQN